MATQAITEFDSWSIANSSIQFVSGGQKQPGVKFGSVGTLSFEPETTALQKRAGRVIVKEKVVTTKLNVSVSAHIPVNVARDFFGLSNEGLKPGVYSYGEGSLGKEFVWTADVVDDFEDITKLIAFPKASNSAGLTLTIDTTQEELALLELTFSAVADENGKFYYEALVPELEDPTVADQWHSDFTTALVEATETP
ncbi:phage tail protein [Lysinibacillus yapensis]|uniref:Phage tail protein n=1 Tax=Ureibacillus yapensis TaxID=2304605 RepID=A0A396SBG4_9BACL|nr:phage tail protein [Lysinibacillus yapensis]RHW38701.1 phage tail protein [Lysinibacillus yapensis]